MQIYLHSYLPKICICNCRLHLSIPPSNRLEKLKGEKKSFYSIRINDQWRITFKWIDGHSYNVEIVDYH